MDQSIIQYLKCHYRVDFMRNLINEDSSIKEYQSNFNIKDATFSVGLAWNAVKSVTLKTGRRKL
jgi:hypothetical protein